LKCGFVPGSLDVLGHRWAEELIHTGFAPDALALSIFCIDSP
jgi:hypothetical protein